MKKTADQVRKDVAEKRLIEIKDVRIEKPKSPRNEFSLRGQGKTATCSFSPY
jgi:hypothetical protein